MSKLSVNPAVLGIGAFVVAMTGSSALAADLDATSTDAVDDSLLTIAGTDEDHGDGDEGKCGEGQCGEGQCGDDDGEGEDEEEGEEEEEA